MWCLGNTKILSDQPHFGSNQLNLFVQSFDYLHVYKVADINLVTKLICTFNIVLFSL
jgi:hypothetical protein